jgi:hypothetical protein
MSTNNAVDPNVLNAAIKAILLADDELRGIDYLNGSGEKIFTGRAPKGVTGAYVVIETRPGIYPDPDGQGRFRGEPRIHCYAPILSNGQIGRQADKISKRVQELVNDLDVGFSITGMAVISCEVTDVIPAVVDSSVDESKAHGVIMLRIEFGYT